MKLKAIYNIDEPLNPNSDSISIRILTEPDPNEPGGYEYAFEVTTVKFIEEWKAKNKKKYYHSVKEPLLIVQRLDHETIRKAVEDILPNIDNIAMRVE